MPSTSQAPLTDSLLGIVRSSSTMPTVAHLAISLSVVATPPRVGSRSMWMKSFASWEVASVDLLFAGSPRQHRVGRGRGLKADREEYDLLLWIGAGNLQAVERRVHDADVAAQRLHGE